MDGLFGSTKTEASVPQYVEDMGKEAAQRASDRNAVGYVPFYGPETAGFTPQQMAAFQGSNQQSAALGLPTAKMQIPTATDFGGGLTGYNSASLMEDNLAKLKAAKPDVYEMLMRLQEMQSQGGQANPMDPNANMAVRDPNDYGGRGGDRGPSGNGFSGFGGGFGDFLGDAFDGGGFGASGDTFSGGGSISGIGNAFGGPSAFGRGS